MWNVYDASAFQQASHNARNAFTRTILFIRHTFKQDELEDKTWEIHVKCF